MGNTCYLPASRDLKQLDELSGVMPEETLQEDVDKCWERWHTVYMEILHRCIPRKVLPSKKNLPWISHPIIKAMKRRNQLYKKYKSSGSKIALKINKMNNADSKSFWKLYKTITKQKTSIPRLKNLNYSRTPLFELASLRKDSPIISEELL